jgi:hypothetical protein
MNEEPVTIAVVLDPNFGERLSELAAQGPVWITSSPINRAAVEHHWKTAPSGGHAVTYWSEPRSGETEEEWLGILDNLELHHSEPWAGPGIAGILVIGVPLTQAAESALHEFEYTVTSSEPNSFRAVRAVPTNESTPVESAPESPS